MNPVTEDVGSTGNHLASIKQTKTTTHVSNMNNREALEESAPTSSSTPSSRITRLSSAANSSLPKKPQNYQASPSSTAGFGPAVDFKSGGIIGLPDKNKSTLERDLESTQHAHKSTSTLTDSASKTSKDIKKDLKNKVPDPNVRRSGRLASLQVSYRELKQKRIKVPKIKEPEIANQKLIRATAEVDAILSKVGKWPLPPENSLTTKKIMRGETFYAKEPKWPAETSSKYRCPQDISREGMPCKASDFSYRMFIPIFLMENQDKMEKLTAKEVASAFRLCVTTFYSHIHWVHKKMFHTVYGGETIVEEAKAQIKKSLVHHNQATTTPNPLKRNFDSSGIDSEPIAPADQVSNCDNSKKVAKVSEKSELRALNSETEVFDDETLSRYFPSCQGFTQRPCLSCAKTDHQWSNCPSRSCSKCGQGHALSCCPETRRCERCRERGHKVSECPEKLSLPAFEIVCDLCGGTGHIETDCHYIWRTFQPRPKDIFKVQSIKASCYCCGASGHYGSECGLNRHLTLSGAVTWSLANLNTYVDSNSQKRALSFDIDPSPPAKRGFNIKGKASNPYISDDDSDNGRSFIRPKIKVLERGLERGNIRFVPVSNDSYRSGLVRDRDVAIMQSDVYQRDHGPPRGPRFQPPPYSRPYHPTEPVNPRYTEWYPPAPLSPQEILPPTMRGSQSIGRARGSKSNSDKLGR
ncbi:RING finger protein [Blumeria graminis f. sp. tritici 96224]|uniref:RING finger protein n=1 Tax=Blumeria graminis f. sp. tritici 96224 TaxID=1268274 RepID=A0A656KNV2_BLUGR|nr:RING finger protein [Blumeria graminis f. sp. tritici 96224]